MKSLPASSINLTDKRLLVQFEGGAVYTAEQDGKYYVITDENAMASLLDDKDLAGLELVKCLEFATQEERSAYTASRGWQTEAPELRRHRT